MPAWISGEFGQPNQALSPPGVERGVGGRVDAIRPRVPRVEDVPAARARRILLGAAGTDRAPIQRLVIDVHADLGQQVGRHVALGLGDLHVGGDTQDDLFAPVAGLGQQLLRLLDPAGALQDVATGLGIEIGAGGEERRQHLPQCLVVADDGAHVILLAERHHHCAPDPHVVEGRIQVIDPERADIAQRVGDVHVDAAVLLQQRHEVGGRVLPPIDLAVLQRRRLGGVVGHDQPLDAVEHHALAARQPLAGLGARLVAGEAVEHGAGSPGSTRPC